MCLTFEPCLTSCEISSTMVVVFPVPGGPWITANSFCLRANSIASFWLSFKFLLIKLMHPSSSSRPFSWGLMNWWGTLNSHWPKRKLCKTEKERGSSTLSIALKLDRTMKSSKIVIDRTTKIWFGRTSTPNQNRNYRTSTEPNRTTFKWNRPWKLIFWGSFPKDRKSNTRRMI